MGIRSDLRALDILGGGRAVSAVSDLLRRGVLAQYGCGSLLLLAAGLKLYELVTDPSLGILRGSRWLYLAQIEFELLLGVWLLSGIAQFWARRVALVLFAAFACYAVYLLGSGNESCGCFGRAEVNPWFTLLLDATSIGLLSAWTPTFSIECRPKSLAVFLGSACVGALLVTPWAARANLDRTSEAIDGFQDDGRVVILEPEKWIGKRFPLADHIDIGSQLAVGNWSVVLYHHACPKCQALLADMEAAMEFSAGELSHRVAAIEVRSIDGTIGRESTNPRILYGQLSARRDWFVQSPVVIELIEGMVVRISAGKI